MIEKSFSFVETPVGFIRETESNMEKVTIEIFSDYVCPFCRLARPAVNALLSSDLNVEVFWRAFELRPEPVPTLPPDGEYLRRVWNDSVYPLAKKLSMKMKLPPVQPRSRLAHEAAHWARGQRLFEVFNSEIFRAFFEAGEDIGDPEVLISIADEMGLNGDDLREALLAEKYRKNVFADQKLAEQLGVTVVPTFVANRKFALSGIQSFENLKIFVEQSEAV